MLPLFYNLKDTNMLKEQVDGVFQNQYPYMRYGTWPIGQALMLIAAKLDELETLINRATPPNPEG